MIKRFSSVAVPNNDADIGKDTRICSGGGVGRTRVGRGNFGVVALSVNLGCWALASPVLRMEWSNAQHELDNSMVCPRCLPG